MLDTVLKIGKLYREAENAYLYHEQINSVQKDVDVLGKKKDKNGNIIETVYYNLPVIDGGATFKFDFQNLTKIEVEDLKKNLQYLNFKTSKKDAEKRYLLGDIAYSHYIDNKSKMQESGNYRMFSKWEKKTSFIGAEAIANSMSNVFISKFRHEYRNHQSQIESLLKSTSSVVLHFDFEGKSWFSIEGLIDDIDKILSSNFVSEHEETGKYMLNKYLYKTLGGNAPGFIDNAGYKNKSFSIDDIINLMYATQTYQNPTLRIKDIGVVVLPHSCQLTSADIVSFFSKEKNIAVKELDIVQDSVQDSAPVQNYPFDDLFDAVLNNHFDDKVKFDIIFSSIPKSVTGVYSDLIELSNVEKSLLRHVNDNIVKVASEIANLANKEFPNAKKPFYYSVKNSFLNIMGDVTTDKKKFQFHLLKVIPQIYSDAYYQDELLLPAFLEKVESNVRDSGQGFATLKYDFYFLMKIQKKDNLMKIKESNSYAVGKNLGIMARPFAAWRDDCPIKSFEKSYVGNLSRRISSIDDLVKFSAYLNEKLTLHSKLYKEVKQSFLDLSEEINNFDTEKYNKYNCALGFFESYFGKTEQLEEEPENQSIIL